MIVTLALIALLAAVLVPLIRRDLVRARARRRTVTLRITVDATQFAAAMRRATRATADIETTMRQVNRVMAEASDRLKAAQPGPKKTVF